MKHVGMPRSATPATQNDMTTASDTSKKSRFFDYSHRHGHTALTRTVANGCGGLRAVANGCRRKRNVRRTQLYPHTPRVKWEPLLRIRENKPRTGSKIPRSGCAHISDFLGMFGRRPKVTTTCWLLNSIRVLLWDKPTSRKPFCCCCPCIPGCCEKNKEPASNIRIFCSRHFHPPKSEMPKRLKEADNHMRCSDASRMCLSDPVAHVSQILLEQKGIPDGSRGQAACPTSEEASSIKEIRGPANRSGYCTGFPLATGQ